MPGRFGLHVGRLDVVHQPVLDAEQLVQGHVGQDGRGRGIADLRGAHVHFRGDARRVVVDLGAEQRGGRHAAEDLGRGHDHAPGRRHGGGGPEDRHGAEVHRKPIFQGRFQHVARAGVQLQRRGGAIGRRKQRRLVPQPLGIAAGGQRGHLGQVFHLAAAAGADPTGLLRVQQQQPRRFDGLHARVEIAANIGRIDRRHAVQGVAQLDRFDLILHRRLAVAPLGIIENPRRGEAVVDDQLLRHGRAIVGQLAAKRIPQRRANHLAPAALGGNLPLDQLRREPGAVGGKIDLAAGLGQRPQEELALDLQARPFQDPSARRQ